MISKGASIGLALLAAAFSMVAPRSAAAQDYPWCVASQHGAAQHCLFRAKEQCDATASGYGTCIRNYAVPEVSEAPRPPKKRPAKRPPQ